MPIAMIDEIENAIKDHKIKLYNSKDSKMSKVTRIKNTRPEGLFLIIGSTRKYLKFCKVHL